MFEPHFVLALWGLLGAFFYAAWTLITAVLGDQEIGRRGKLKAAAQGVVAVLFGPAAAVAFTPVLIAKAGPAATPTAVAFTIGLMINGVYPVARAAVGSSLRRTIGGWLSTAADALKAGDQPT